MTFVAIIPSLGALGPLGLLALLAPGVFVGLMLWMRRWSAALGAASAMTTVFLFQGWWQAPLRPMWWSTRAGMWAVLAGLAGTFFVWALNRVRPDSAPESDSTRGDRFVVGSVLVVSGLCVALMIYKGRWSESLGLAAIIIFAGAAAGMVATLHRRTAETVLLATLGVGCAGASVFETGRSVLSTDMRVEWIFEADRPGAFLNSPFVAEDRIFLGAAHHDGFHQDGEVYAIDPVTGRLAWSSRGDSDLRPVFGSPCFADRRLYFGEGLHGDRNCRLFCLNYSGRIPTDYWSFATLGHIESNAVVSSPRVYFGAGDDGLYCLDIETGKKLWHLENFHIDATALVHNGVVYVGTYQAEDNQHKDLRLLALDAVTGKKTWSESIDLSSYSQPVIAGNTVYFSLGTGNLESSGPNPGGAVVAIEAATGKQIWRADLPDSVFGSPVINAELALVSCSDGNVYALKRSDGHLAWRYALGSPAIGAAEIEYGHDGSTIIAVSKLGRCVKLAMHDGKLVSEIDLVRAGNGLSGQFTSAPVVSYLVGVGRRVYIAGAITRGIRETPVLFCLMDGF